MIRNEYEQKQTQLISKLNQQLEGKITLGSQVHNPKQGEGHESQTSAESKRLHSSLQLPLMAHAQSTINKPLSPFHRGLTSNFCFSLW